MRRWMLALALTLAALTGGPLHGQVRLPDASDRFAWKPPNRHAADVASNWVLYGSIGTETLRTLTGDHRGRDGWRQACTFGLGQGVALAAKAGFRKTRPDGSNDRSFFSGHTVTAPRWYFAIPVAELRMGAAKHDWVDVLTGGLVGAGSRYACERWIR